MALTNEITILKFCDFSPPRMVFLSQIKWQTEKMQNLTKQIISSWYKDMKIWKRRFLDTFALV